MTHGDQRVLSSEERTIELRTRSDLVIQESVYQDEVCWIVKDPVGMTYFRLRRPERMVLECLKSPTTYEQIRQRLTITFPDVTTRLATVQQLVVSLHQNGLLISNAPGQDIPLTRRRNRELRQKAIGLMSSLISLRFPGFDPERILNFLYPKLRWVFSPWFTFVVILTCLSAVGLIATNWEQFFSRLPEFQQFFAFDNILFMAAMLIVTKTIHEFGHGLMCKHFGGECHEIGFMLLVMTPAMYCNTSDSWILPNRWHRMAIGAAGMYIELFLAAVCTFVWWFTHPGWIHYLALNVMFLSSVSTIIFNANPLLRYDGYYILSDFLEIPNMAQKGKLALLSTMRVFCLGMKPVHSRQLPEQHRLAFAVYSASAFVYRWAIVFVIFWFIAEVFEPIGLSAIGHILIAISLVGMIVVPFFKMIQFFRYPGRMREVKQKRMVSTAICLSALIAVLVYVPFPHYVWTTFVIRPDNPQSLVLGQPGILTRISVEPGSKVEPGQVLAELDNDPLKLEMLDLEIQKARLEGDLSAYKLMSSTHQDSTSRLAEAQASLDAVQSQIRLKREQLAQSQVVASRSGVYHSPENRLVRPPQEPQLTTWMGTPLESSNRGSYLESNTDLGSVCDPDCMNAVVVIHQSDIQLVTPGQKVIALGTQLPNSSLRGKVEYVSQDEMATVPRELSQTNGGPVAVTIGESGQEKPLLKSYEARVKITVDEPHGGGVRLLPGMRGQAKIHVGSSSIANRIYRYLCSVVNF